MFQFFVIWLASTLISAWLRPKPDYNSPQPDALGDFQAPTAEYGRVEPVPYGRCHLKGPNVVWYGDLRTEAITEDVGDGFFNNDTITVGYRYYLGMQLAFCAGFSPRDLERGSGLVELRFDGKRPTGTTIASVPQFFIGPTLRGLNANGSTYNAEVIHPEDYAKQYVRLTIDEPDIFGGKDGEGGFGGVIDFYYGQGGQEPNDYLQNAWGENDIPAFRGTCYAVLRQCYVGNSRYIKSVSAVVQHYPWLFATSQGWEINGDANPVAVIADMLTNRDYGLGRPVSSLDMDSFTYAANTCNAENLGISMNFDSAMEANAFVREVLRHIDGVLYRDPNTGAYKIKLARADYDVRELPTLDESNVLALSMTRAAWSDTKNIVKIRYTDRDADYTTAVVEHKNQANIDIRGVKDEDTYDFLGLSNAEAANKVAARVLKSVSTPLARFTIKATRDVFDLYPCAVFKLSWEELGIEQMVCRVTNIAYGQLTDPTITIEAIEDVFGVMETQVAVPTNSGWTNPAHESLAPNVAARLEEAPYHLVGSERKVMTMAERSGHLTLGYKVMVNDGGMLTQSSVVQTFTPGGAVAQAATAQATELRVTLGIDRSKVTTASAADRDAGRTLVLIDNEVLAYTTVTANPDGTHTLGGLLRGVLDTLPADHAVGSRAWFISKGLGLVRSTAYTTDTSVEAKLLPYNSREQSDLIDEPALSTTTNSRALRPYPPGKVAAAFNPATGDATLTWAHRPKSTLRDLGRIVGQDADGYEAEAGTTYTVEVRIGGVLKRTETTNGASFTYTSAMQTTDGATSGTQVDLTLAAEQGGYTSAQRHASVTLS